MVRPILVVAGQISNFSIFQKLPFAEIWQAEIMGKTGVSISRRFLLPITGALGIACASCAETPRPEPDVHRLAADVHVSIGGRTLTLPFAALERYAYRGISFSLNRDADEDFARDETEKLIENASDPDHPMVLRDLSIVIRTYGWNDSDMRQVKMCPLLTRAWARSVCDNPWAATQQALPHNRFLLVDQSKLGANEADDLFNCIKESDRLGAMTGELEKPAIVCQASIHSDLGNKFYSAAVRLDHDLIAIWTVWKSGNDGTAEAMAVREGEAITSFVRNGIGSVENFAKLHIDMCRLRQPGSKDAPNGADCEQPAPKAAL